MDPAMVTALAAFIGSLGLLFLNLMSARKVAAETRKVNADTRRAIDEMSNKQDRTLEQVANSHPTNLRDDLDAQARKLDRHGEQIGELSELVRNVASEIREERRELRDLGRSKHETHAEIFQRLTALERYMQWRRKRQS